MRSTISKVIKQCNSQAPNDRGWLEEIKSRRVQPSRTPTLIKQVKSKGDRWQRVVTLDEAWVYLDDTKSIEPYLKKKEKRAALPSKENARKSFLKGLWWELAIALGISCKLREWPSKLKSMQIISRRRLMGSLYTNLARYFHRLSQEEPSKAETVMPGDSPCPWEAHRRKPMVAA
ncbi:hypothetical protein C0J52_19624 [Blattella germanica]|nr:hypothetical protein C0J52_19624 [Blattella germanica]